MEFHDGGGLVGLCNFLWCLLGISRLPCGVHVLCFLLVGWLAIAIVTLVLV